MHARRSPRRALRLRGVARRDGHAGLRGLWKLLERGRHGTLPNGILYLKGGDLAEELAATGRRWTLYDIARFFDEEFFETKKVVYTPRV